MEENDCFEKFNTIQFMTFRNQITIKVVSTSKGQLFSLTKNVRESADIERP
jgi:hypothetical protein